MAVSKVVKRIDFIKVVRMVFWSGVVGPGTNVEISLARASRSALVRFALKSSTYEQVYGKNYREKAGRSYECKRKTGRKEGKKEGKKEGWLNGWTDK